jgi:hypothetical protein
MVYRFVPIFSIFFLRFPLLLGIINFCVHSFFLFVLIPTIFSQVNGASYGGVLLLSSYRYAQQLYSICMRAYLKSSMFGFKPYQETPLD